MAMRNGEHMQECFHNTRSWEQQEWNKTEKEEDKKRCVIMESKTGTKNEVPKAETIAQSYLPSGSLRPETVDEFPN